MGHQALPMVCFTQLPNRLQWGGGSPRKQEWILLIWGVPPAPSPRSCLGLLLWTENGWTEALGLFISRGAAHNSDALPALGQASGGWQLPLLVSRNSHSWSLEFPPKNHGETGRLRVSPRQSHAEAAWTETCLTGPRSSSCSSLGARRGDQESLTGTLDLAVL